MCKGVWETGCGVASIRHTYYYDCVFGNTSIEYCFDKWWIKADWEYGYLFNLAFKTHAEAIVHLDKECYKYIQEAVKYLK